MPLIRTEPLGEESAWALWRIEESEEELAFLAMETCPDDVVAPAKRREFLAGRSLIKRLVEHVGRDYVGLTKDKHGKPFLKDLSHMISLSHSSPYVAAQIHPTLSVGIDIEQPKEKLLRVAPRVLLDSELHDAANDIVKHCIYWSAKEALYKIYGKRGVHMSNQLNVDPFERQRAGTIRGYVSAGNERTAYTLGYVVESDCVVVYTSY